MRGEAEEEEEGWVPGKRLVVLFTHGVVASLPWRFFF